MSAVAPSDAAAAKPAKPMSDPAAREPWQDTFTAAHEVIAERLGLIWRGHSRAIPELQRAVLEKLDFCARWSLAFGGGGWLTFDATFAAMLDDAGAKIRENRDRLTER